MTISQLWLKLVSLFSPKQKFPPKSFTYYIPAPPKRTTGYQEKELDKILTTLFSYGFKLLELKTEGHKESEKSGLWVIAILEPLNEKAHSLDITLIDNSKQTSENSGVKPEQRPVEGIYYFD